MKTILSCRRARRLLQTSAPMTALVDLVNEVVSTLHDSNYHNDDDDDETASRLRQKTENGPHCSQKDDQIAAREKLVDVYKLRARKK